jgi:hypothetical protein
MSRSRPRRGVISVAVLVCLLVMTIIVGGLLRMIHTQRVLVRSEERRLQADWLAESGVERALARLGDDPAYRGETWTLPAAELGGPEGGVVSISALPRPGHEATERLVTVLADYPTEPARRVRARRQVVVAVSPERQGEGR